MRRKRLTTTTIHLLALNAFFAELRLYYPVAVLAFAAVTGSYARAMGFFSILFLAQAFLEIPTGVFSDKIGRKRTFIIGSAAEVLAAILIACATVLPYSIFYLYSAAFCVGLGNALHSGNTDALLVETLSTHRCAHLTAKALGRINAFSQLGLALSGLLASLALTFGASYQELMIASLIPTSISFIPTLFIHEPFRIMKDKHSSFNHVFHSFVLITKNPTLRMLTIASSLRIGLENTAHSFSPSFIESVWPSWMTPLYRTAQNGLGAVGFWFIGAVKKKWGLKRSLYYSSIYSFLISGIAYASSAFFSPFLLLLSQIFYTIRSTSENALKQEEFSSGQRSTQASISSLAGSLVGAGASVLAGFLADTLSPAQNLSVLLFLTLPTLILYRIVFKPKS